MRYVFVIITLFLIILSCKQEEICIDSHEELSGSYLFYSETDTSENKVEFYSTLEGFETTGLSGSDFWYPVASLSGYLDNCNIIINEYKNVRREGLPSPGGFKRYYYESMDGHGQFFPDNDSIILFIHYTRTENFTVDFSGNLFFKKIN